jgi:hypothetical protein
MKHTYYFTHDFHARNDPKMSAMLFTWRAQGYGWFWMIVEMLAEEENHRLPLSDMQLQGMARQCGCGEERLRRFIGDCIGKYNLFASDGEYFWSDSLLRRIKALEDVIQARRAAGQKGMAARWHKNTEDNSVITGEGGVITKNNKGKERKEEEMKGEERKRQETTGDERKESSGALQAQSFDGQPYADAYNRICTLLPPISRITDKRREALMLFAREYTLEDFITICQHAQANPYCNGENHKRWKANFDCLIQPDRAVALLEGHYNMRDEKPQEPKKPERDPAERLWDEITVEGMGSEE